MSRRAEDGVSDAVSAAANTLTLVNQALAAADSHDVIRVVGARENNLRGISLEIPKRRLTVFTGVSGLGQVVAGLRHHRRRVAAADQRDLLHLRPGVHAQPQPPGRRRAGEPERGHRRRPGADGRQRPLHPRHGDRRERDAADRLQPARPAIRRAVVPLRLQRARRACARPARGWAGSPTSTSTSWSTTARRSTRARSGCPATPRTGGTCGSTPSPAWSPGTSRSRDFTDQQRQDFLYHEPMKVKTQGINLTYEGLVPKVQKSILTKDRDSVQPHIAAFIDRAVTYGPCPSCGGTRLNEAARSSTIDGISIADACAMQISDLAEFVRGLTAPEVAPLVATLQQTLDSLVEIGLGYLSLERSSGSLSGGEAQRVKMVRHLGSPLTDVTYVFDEPTVGLHPHDIARMNDLLIRLRDKGNTVLVVEHKPETISVADHVVDLGPGAGTNGGTVQFEGTVADLRASGTLTGRHLDDRARLKTEVRTATGALPIRGRHHPQPAGRRRRRAARGDDRGHRRGGLGQELADPRVAAAGRRGGDRRPVRDPRLAAQQPGHLHRAARPDPHRLRQGEQGQAGPVQRELRGRLPALQRRRRHLHRPGHDGRGGDEVRPLRRQAVPGRGAGVQAGRQGHQRGAGHVGRRGAGLLRLRGPRTRSWTGWPPSAWAT